MLHSYRIKSISLSAPVSRTSKTPSPFISIADVSKFNNKADVQAVSFNFDTAMPKHSWRRRVMPLAS